MPKIRELFDRAFHKEPKPEWKPGKSLQEYDWDHIKRVQFKTKTGDYAKFVKERTGKWIRTDETDEWYGRLYRCSECNTFVLCGVDNYCPFCGARMTNDDKTD